MESKVIEAGKPIEIKIEPSLGGAGARTLSLTIIEEIAAGSDRRVYKVKDQQGLVYAYKYMKRRTLKKEVERADSLSKAGVPYAAMVASGRDLEEKGVGYTLREWIDGFRGDAWLHAWESFDASVQAEAIADLILLLDTLASKGLYAGKLDPEDMVFSPSFHGSPRWVIVDCGSVKYDIPPYQAADRYFWKFVERWGMKLDRQGPSFLNLFKLLVPIGRSFPRPTPLLQPVGVNPHLAVTKSGDDDDDDDDDGESEISEGMKPLVVTNVRSAYPATTTAQRLDATSAKPLGEPFRGGSYEVLRDGTERINGVVVPPLAPGEYSGGRYENAVAAGDVVALDMNSAYGKNVIKEEESTIPEESATPTVEDSNKSEPIDDKDPGETGAESK